MIGCLDSGGRVDRLRRPPTLSKPSWSKNGSNSLTRLAESGLMPNSFTWTSLSHSASASDNFFTERLTLFILSLTGFWQFRAKRKQCLSSSILATGSVGQFSLSCISHGGPCHHKAVFIRVPSEQPRLGMSAGFSLVGQYLQHWGDTDSCISCTRFATNGFQRAGAPLIHARATLLSLQQVISWIDSVSSLSRYFFNIAHSNAAISSSLGRLTCFIGATRDFAITRLTNLWWFIDSTMMYAQAAYATCDASSKMWSSTLRTCCTGCSCQLRHCFSMSGGNSVSQPSPSVHKR
ncbi:hypothetical protein T02_6330 [Trichinella nativa]|uniref:Uncharacterized protein n=1 Tax=Trichinella nativa TaxID=6335 RepID=A0A0V1KKI4_9BILA|nr:hypothetical protein T02_2657 [Trichinella nativa]KRZ50336.1 hypothetical protein T02_6330 [Trichinella nativa]